MVTWNACLWTQGIEQTSGQHGDFSYFAGINQSLLLAFMYRLNQSGQVKVFDLRRNIVRVVLEQSTANVEFDSSKLSTVRCCIRFMQNRLRTNTRIIV